MTDALPRTAGAIRDGMERGLHIGAQLYVSLRGKVAADVALGESRRGVPMRPDTLMLWLSSTKPIAAAAIAQQWERGKLELDDAVAKHLPEFAAHGKDSITIRHLLAHTGGIRSVLGKWENQPWDRIIVAVCDARIEPGWVPGKKAGYHAASSWYVLAEVVRRLDGRPFERYAREEIFLPNQMDDCWICMSPERYRAYGNRLGLMHDTSKGEAHPAYAQDTESGAGICRPGSSGHGPIRELGRFYEMLLNRGAAAAVDGGPGSAGMRILSPQSVEAMTARHRTAMFDHTFRHVIDWGLGVMLNSAMYGVDTVPYGFGPHASPRAFGHGGSQSSTGFADPEHGLAVAWLLNGTPGEKRHDPRIRAINATIYEDLHLA